MSSFEVMSKAEAKALGFKKFFTGLPCQNQHIDYRHVYSGECVSCVRDKSKRYNDTRGGRGYYAKNKDSINQRRRIHQEKNRERINLQKCEWTKRNPESVRITSQKTYQRHRLKVKKSQAIYYAKNPGPSKARARNRRAKLRNANGTHSAEDIFDIRRMQKDRCAICRCKLHGKGDIDHIIPLFRGGPNDRKNLQLLCESCNSKKSSKDPIDFARELGRLL